MKISNPLKSHIPQRSVVVNVLNATFDVSLKRLSPHCVTWACSDGSYMPAWVSAALKIVPLYFTIPRRFPVVWPDGWGVYAVHGVRVPRRVVEAPETLTP